ncbi:unnamed protein product [Cylindrotheca closterium]|uniref:Uncharacterized protein n=1 Tax=Cylindrotheca closterium TaxID=2856 RepID=A0AAD2CTI1_9STRA|nr:unnamed protein product [Cylindrotheca closterium]
MAEAATSDAANIGSSSSQSVKDIAAYLENTIPKEAWNKDERPCSKTKFKTLATNVQKIWDKPFSPLLLQGNLQGLFMSPIKEDQLEVAVDDLMKFLEQGGKKPGTNVYQQERQFVGISHKVIDTALTHDFDILFYISDLTFYKKGNEGESYGPYICFVQLSGMGKTKIFYKMCKHYKMNEKGKSKSGKGESKSGINIVGRLILCHNPHSLKAETGPLNCISRSF